MGIGVIDLFAGPGGWDQGLAMLGRRDVVGVEWDGPACETARAAGHARVQADVASLDPREFAISVDWTGEGLIASPPCQSWSMAGKGKGRAASALVLAAVVRMGRGESADVIVRDLCALVDDERTALVVQPLRWVLDLRPRWTAWEQVPTVLPLWGACADVLRAFGYQTWAGCLAAETFGVPQTRKRAFLIAALDREVGPPPPTHSRYYPRSPQRLDPGMPRWVSMAEALGHGATARPSMTITGGGTMTGGAEPFGNAARKGLTKEMKAGRWLHRSVCDPTTEPAATHGVEASA